MAKKDNGQSAGSRLETLRAQIGALLARRRELSVTTSQPDNNDPLGWAAKAGVAGAEVAAIDKALPMLEAEARAAEAQLAAAREAEQAEAAARMRAEIPDQLKVVVAAADALGQTLDALLKHEQAIRALGGWVPVTYCNGLRQALAGARGEWRKTYPELLGLPPTPSREQVALAEARADVERAKGQLEQIKQAPTGLHGEGTSEKERRTKEAEAQVQRAKQRVKDLEQAAKTPRVKTVMVDPAPEVVTLPPAGTKRTSSGPGRSSHWEDD